MHVNEEIEKLINRIEGAAIAQDPIRKLTYVFVYTYEDYLYRSDIDRYITNELRQRGITVLIRLVPDRKPIPNPYPLPAIFKPEDWQDFIVPKKQKGF